MRIKHPQRGVGSARKAGRDAARGTAPTMAASPE